MAKAKKTKFQKRRKSLKDRKKIKNKARSRTPGYLEEPDELSKAPHAIVTTRGALGLNLKKLCLNFREIMEPFTASQLKSTKYNSIKDFVHVASYFHVTHLCIFSQTSMDSYLKVLRLPRGPTLTFKLHSYSLIKDVRGFLKSSDFFKKDYQQSPLVILNNFGNDELHLKMVSSMFQNMFPAINLSKVKLQTIRRCLFINYEPQNNLIQLRHYSIRLRPVLKKPIRKLVTGKIPDLSHLNDIDEIIDRGKFSESETEDETNQIVLSQQYTKVNKEGLKSAVKLIEIGPRITLELVKIVEGLMDGEVLYHAYKTKTEEEMKAMERKIKKKKLLKQQRIKRQEENKKIKEEQKCEAKERSLHGMKKLEKTDEDADHSDIEDDTKYYEEEVGEKPHIDLFNQNTKGTKRPKKFSSVLKKTKKRIFDEQVPRAYKKRKVGTSRESIANRDFRPIGK